LPVAQSSFPQPVEGLLRLGKERVARGILVVRLGPADAVVLGAQLRQISSVVNFTAIQLSILAMFNIKVLAVSHVDSYIVFFVTTVWLALRRAREEHVTDLPQEAPVPGICVSELESNLAACAAGLTEFRSNVSFVNVNVHGLPLFFDKSGEADSCQRMIKHGEIVAKLSSYVKKLSMSYPTSLGVFCSCQTGVLMVYHKEIISLPFFPRMVSVHVSTTIVVV